MTTGNTASVKPVQLGEFQCRLIDVRGLDEFASERLPAAECVPLDRLLQSAKDWDRSERLVLVCKSGMRSARAAEQLRAAGFRDILNLEGGIDVCKRAGMEVVVDRKRLPIIRQVMITAGLLALTGLGLSLVQPGFVVVAWFIACGLVLSGVTGYCPMAELLKRMPWNAELDCQNRS
jgi:rhodanese-related sulfurtransferase